MSMKAEERIEKLEKRLANVIRLQRRSYIMARKYEVQEAKISRLITKLESKRSPN